MKAGDWAIHYRLDYFDKDNKPFGMYECGKLTTYNGPAYFNGPEVTFLCFNNYGGKITTENAEAPLSHPRYGHEGRLWKDDGGNFYTWSELIANHPSINCSAMTQLSRGVLNLFAKNYGAVAEGWDLGDNNTPSTKEQINVRHKHQRQG